jgi:hypothetical protein
MLVLLTAEIGSQDLSIWQSTVSPVCALYVQRTDYCGSIAWHMLAVSLSTVDTYSDVTSQVNTFSDFRT